MAQLLRRLRRLPDRLLHTSRRRAARAALAARQPLRSVLVVCNGNIFRSPFAAAVLKRELDQEGVAVDSAGFIGPGRPSPADAVAAAARRGVDLRRHRSQLLTPDLVRAADVILVMDAAQRRSICERFGRAPQDVLLLGDFDPLPIEVRAIQDPVEQSPAVCDAVYARIEDCVGTLVRGLRAAAIE
ncbi:MAG TPA: hypothetical protein VEO58_01265 [Gemmatimonadales bacterium]|nr:hypothetical protein [Gemmatimonadales bacterium]